MTSSSDFGRYKAGCESIIESAIDRPSMMYRKLDDLTLTMFGHLVGYDQLGCLPHGVNFNLDFCDWLWDSQSESASDGWGNAIERIAARRGAKPHDVFSELVLAFLDQWNPTDAEEDSR
jgi:hypothetical protein